VLASAARLAGEPGEPFTAELLHDYITEHPSDHTHSHTARGLKAHSLRALLARGYVDVTTRRYFLTEAGWDEAERLTGGRGLL
jgi:hypothetical protein